MRECEDGYVDQDGSMYLVGLIYKEDTESMLRDKNLGYSFIDDLIEGDYTSPLFELLNLIRANGLRPARNMKNATFLFNVNQAQKRGHHFAPFIDYLIEHWEGLPVENARQLFHDHGFDYRDIPFGRCHYVDPDTKKLKHGNIIPKGWNLSWLQQQRLLGFWTGMMYRKSREFSPDNLDNLRDIYTFMNNKRLKEKK